jgi:hypothetical protein
VVSDLNLNDAGKEVVLLWAGGVRVGIQANVGKKKLRIDAAKDRRGLDRCSARTWSRGHCLFMLRSWKCVCIVNIACDSACQNQYESRHSPLTRLPVA